MQQELIDLTDKKWIVIDEDFFDLIVQLDLQDIQTLKFVIAGMIANKNVEVQTLIRK